MRRGVCALAVLVVLWAGQSGVAAQAFFEEALARLRAIVADPATPDVPVATRWKPAQVPPGDYWPDARVAGMCLAESGSVIDGYGVLDPELGRLVGYVAGRRPGSPPTGDLAPEEALRIARGFAERQFPHLFAPGGDVEAEVEETAADFGVRMAHFRRVLQGIRMPNYADIGVRVDDGQVVWARWLDEPPDPAVQLPGDVTEEQAKLVVETNAPNPDMEVVSWLDAVHEVVLTRNGQRNCWNLRATYRLKSQPAAPFPFVASWRVDANTAAVLSREMTKVDLPSVAAAGPAGAADPGGNPLPERAYVDAWPLWSPDGSLIAFTSDRLRGEPPAAPDYPSGLFVVPAEGGEVRCLEPAAASGHRWSPDSRRLSYRSGADLCVMPVEGGEPLRFSPPRGQDLTGAIWLDDHRLVVTIHEGGARLEVLDLDDLDAPRKPLVAEPDVLRSIRALAATPGGNTLYYSVYNGVDRNDEWDLFSLDLTAPDAAPVLVTDKPGEGRAAQLLPYRTLFVWDDRAGMEGIAFFLVDLASGQSKPYRPRDSRPPRPGTSSLSPRTLTFSPDGQRVVFAASVIQGTPHGILGTVLWTAAADGSDLKQLTPLDDTPVPVAGR